MKTLEIFHNLSTKKDSSPRFVTRVLEEESEFVRAEIAVPPPGQSSGRPSESTYTLEAPTGTVGNDGNELSDPDIVNALPLLDKADLFNLLCIPPYKTSDESTSFRCL